MAGLLVDRPRGVATLASSAERSRLPMLMQSKRKQQAGPHLSGNSTSRQGCFAERERSCTEESMIHNSSERKAVARAAVLPYGPQMRLLKRVCSTCQIVLLSYKQMLGKACQWYGVEMHENYS